MPGHARRRSPRIPELGVHAGEPIEVAHDVGRRSTTSSMPTDATFTFLQDVLTRGARALPGRVHPHRRRRGRQGAVEGEPRGPGAHQRELGLKDEHELQSWFIRQIDTFLTSSRTAGSIGWDEILEGGLAPDATVMSWRGTKGGIAAARAGHDVVMTPTSHTYFDYYQSTDRRGEPLAIGGFLPLETVYAYEPVPRRARAASAKHVLGAQAQLWTEYMPDAKQVEYMAFPRLAALAEVVWTPRERRRTSPTSRRGSTAPERLRILDVNFRSKPTMSQRVKAAIVRFRPETVVLAAFLLVLAALRLAYGGPVTADKLTAKVPLVAMAVDRRRRPRRSIRAGKAQRVGARRPRIARVALSGAAGLRLAAGHSLFPRLREPARRRQADPPGHVRSPVGADRRLDVRRPADLLAPAHRQPVADRPVEHGILLGTSSHRRSSARCSTLRAGRRSSAPSCS